MIGNNPENFGALPAEKVPEKWQEISRVSANLVALEKRLAEAVKDLKEIHIIESGLREIRKDLKEKEQAIKTDEEADVLYTEVYTRIDDVSKTLSKLLLESKITMDCIDEIQTKINAAKLSIGVYLTKGN
jgi:hypothetical protein